MFARHLALQNTREYLLLKEGMGNLTPTIASVEKFCKRSPDWGWQNYPIYPERFPVYPRTTYAVSKTVARRLYQLVCDSDRNSVEYSFLLGGYNFGVSHTTHSDYRCLNFDEIHFNRGSSFSSELSIENQYVVEAFNSKPDQVMMLGHTHPNYGPTRRCFSIADILFGITYISWLRQRMPQSPYEACFSLAYMGDDGVLKHVPLMYDPSLQKRGGSAIFLLDYKRL